jgi:LysM repeat protein
MRRPSFREIALLLPVLMLVTGVVIAFAQAGGSYTVQPGDVLDLIAAEFNVDLDCLADANQLGNPARIFPGQVLTIPGNCPPYSGLSTPRPDRDEAADDQGGGAAAQAAQPGPGDDTYTIVRGDTFDTIGQRLDVSVEALLAANPDADPTALLPGDVIIIPGNAPRYGEFFILGAGQGGGGAPGARAGERVYVVQPRDVLDLIAAALDVDLQCLIARNELSDPPLIYPGQQVIIPANCPPYAGLSIALTLRAPVYDAGELPGGTGGDEAAQPTNTPAPGAASATPTREVFGGAQVQASATPAAPTPTLEVFEQQAEFITPTLRGDQGGGAAVTSTPTSTETATIIAPSATPTPDLTGTALANPQPTSTVVPATATSNPTATSAPATATTAAEATEASAEEESPATVGEPLATAQPAIIVTDAP